MKRIFSFTLSLIYICFAFFPSLPVGAQASGEGLNFDSYKQGKNYAMDSYESAKNLEAVPHTFEAWIYAEKSGWASGVILGNDNANQMRIDLKTERFDSHFLPIIIISSAALLAVASVGIFFLIRAKKKRAEKDVPSE